MVIVENWVEDIATICGLPTEHVKEINFYQEGQPTHFSQELKDNQTMPVWKEVLRSSDYQQLRSEVEAFNSKNRWRKRGLAAIPTKFGIAFTASFLNQVTRSLSVGDLPMNSTGWSLG